MEFAVFCVLMSFATGNGVAGTGQPKPIHEFEMGIYQVEHKDLLEAPTLRPLRRIISHEDAKTVVKEFIIPSEEDSLLPSHIAYQIIEKHLDKEFTEFESLRSKNKGISIAFLCNGDVVASDDHLENELMHTKGAYLDQSEADHVNLKAKFEEELKTKGFQRNLSTKEMFWKAYSTGCSQGKPCPWK